MKISEVSIKRPITTFMAVCVVLILGFISFSRLNVDLLPDINLPIAVVSTSYSGAGPKEVEGIVTKNLENVLATVSNIKSTRSVSSEGNSLIILEFNEGTDMDFATLDIREKIDLIKRMLPEEVGTPMVLKLNPNMMPIMSLGIAEQGKDMESLKAWVEEVIKPRIERIEGVASVNIMGASENEVKIIVDEDRLNSYGLSMTQIVNALRMENINAPGGIIADGKYDLLVRTTGEFKSIDDIKNVPIMTQTGASFLLSDIAKVEEGPKETSVYSKINGEDSLSISIQKESTANTSRVSEKINKELDSIRASFKDVNIVTIVDQSKFINQSINSVKNNALLGGVLAIIILFLFLKDIRPTVVIAVSIPISIVATFILIYFANITLNMISLGGLALGVGMLVDNSIVVLENIYRLRREGYTRIEAAKQGSNQVTMAIIASTLTTVCVFLPIVFVEGITAEIFKQMALTVTFSLLASLVVALTLVPLLSSKLLGEAKFNSKNKFIDAIRDKYSKLLHWSLHHRKTVILTTIVVFAFSIFSLQIIGTEFFPSTDQGQINISVTMPRGTTYKETAKALSQVEEVVAREEEVETIYSSLGGSQQGFNMGGASRDSGNISVVLKSLDERKRSTDEVVEILREKTEKIVGCEVEISGAGDIMSGGQVGGSPISVEIQGENLDTLEEISKDVISIVEGVEGTREVRSDFEKGAPEMRVNLERDKASLYGLNVAMVSGAVRNQLQGAVATRYKVEGKELDVRVLDENKDTLKATDIENIYVTSPLGINVPLKSIAKIEYADGYVSIERMDQQRVVTVSSALSGRTVGRVVEDIEKELENYNMPKGYSYNIGGQNEQMMDAFSSLGLALILAVILVYMVMASQFESLIYPFIIMFSVPLAFTGAFLGLLVTGTPLSVPAILGMLVLSGIVVNNGIVLVDYINTLRNEGKLRNEAILQAGPTRLQPILMTTLTTILGLLPLAIGIGEGAELELPLAVTVIGGLTLSTILTLVVVPVTYTLFDDFGKKIKAKFKKEEVLRGE